MSNPYGPQSPHYWDEDSMTWKPAQPIGWREEHGWFARLIFRLRGVEHCNDREGQRR